MNRDEFGIDNIESATEVFEEDPVANAGDPAPAAAVGGPSATSGESSSRPEGEPATEAVSESIPAGSEAVASMEEPASEERGATADSVSGLSEQISALTAQVEELSAKTQEMAGMLESRTVSQAVFQHFDSTISAKLDRVKLSLTADILREIIRLREDMARFLANARAKKDELTVGPLLDSFGNFDSAILEILECRGVTHGRAEVGTPFDSRTQKIVMPVVPTDDDDLDRTLQQVLSDCYELEGRVISPSLVKVFSKN